LSTNAGRMVEAWHPFSTTDTNELVSIVVL